MNISQQEFHYLTESTMRDLTVILMERKGLTLSEALEELYNSDTLKALLDPETGLYYQTAGYVYSYLDNEMSTGKMM